MSEETFNLFREIVSQAKKISLEMGFEEIAKKYEKFLDALKLSSPDTVDVSICILDPGNGKTYVIPRTQIPALLRQGGDEARAVIDYWRRL